VITDAPSRPFATRPIPSSGELVSLNRSKLAVFTLGDAVLEREIVELFLGQIDDLTAALAAAVSARDWYMAAHTIKGSAAAIGAEQTAAAAHAAERLIDVSFGADGARDYTWSSEVGRESMARDIGRAIARLRGDWARLQSTG
jgi:HPt (histidine-containing phosphotransfer) domain-containing protein